MKIPDYLIESTLKDLLPDEKVYTVPWAMYADEYGQLWLNGSYSFHPQPELGGTVQMGVERINGGYRVDLSRCREKRFSLGKPGYVGDFVPLQVIDLL